MPSSSSTALPQRHSDCRCHPWVTTRGTPPSSMRHIECQGDALRAEVLKPASTCSDLRDRRAADHDPCDPELQHLRERRGVAQAAAHLQIERLARRQLDDDARDCPRLHRWRRRDRRRAASRRRASRYLASRAARIQRIARLRVEVAVQQPHAVSGLQIDGGNESHARRQRLSSARKFCSRRAPTARSARDGIARRRNCAIARRR